MTHLQDVSGSNPSRRLLHLLHLHVSAALALEEYAVVSKQGLKGPEKVAVVADAFSLTAEPRVVLRKMLMDSIDHHSWILFLDQQHPRTAALKMVGSHMLKPTTCSTYIIIESLIQRSSLRRFISL